MLLSTSSRGRCSRAFWNFPAVASARMSDNWSADVLDARRCDGRCHHTPNASRSRAIIGNAGSRIHPRFGMLQRRAYQLDEAGPALMWGSALYRTSQLNDEDQRQPV